MNELDPAVTDGSFMHGLINGLAISGVIWLAIVCLIVWLT